MQTKKCSKCGNIISVEMFSKNSKAKDGLRCSCKLCDRDYRNSNKERISKFRHEYYINNKEKELRLMKLYREANEEKIKILRKEYHTKNKNKLNKKAKQWRLENIAVMREYYNKHKDKILEYGRLYRIANKERLNKKNLEYRRNKYCTDEFFKCTMSIRNSISAAFNRMKFEKQSPTGNIIGCDWEFFKSYIESKFTEGMDWDNYGDWEYDHIIPLSTAKTKEGVIRLNHYTNFQPLWKLDNRIKSNKIPKNIQKRLL